MQYTGSFNYITGGPETPSPQPHGADDRRPPVNHFASPQSRYLFSKIEAKHLWKNNGIYR
jgi:hypothetical protein